MSDHSPVAVRMWLAEPMPKEVSVAIDRLSRADDVCHLAVMPDVHLAREVCVGAVLATRSLIYPDAVGGDIGCGMTAIASDVAADKLQDAKCAAKLLEGLRRATPINRKPGGALPAQPGVDQLSDGKLQSIGRRDGRVQFGTLGRGNHFLEFQADEENRLWLMVHSGSRAMGQAIRAFHKIRAKRSAGGLAYLDAKSAEGLAYLSDASWACAYAAESRRAMIDAAAELTRGLLGATLDATTYFSCDHNHVREETHFGERLWVHRKGAASARAGEAGIIPGSMGAESYHVEGRGCAESLCSSSHGAGRTMSRHEARQKVSMRELHRQLKEVWIDPRVAESLREEAPSAYKDVRAVMRAQRDLTRIVRKLRPVLCYKGK
jgi:tRNA-splicing ligase RtcB (3'-phosphate/5'-hydroxy nucleic acid ligase)